MGILLEHTVMFQRGHGMLEGCLTDLPQGDRTDCFGSASAEEQTVCRVALSGRVDN